MLNILGAKTYRIILQRLEIEYYYQGKMDAEARFEVDEAWLEENVFTPLEKEESVIVPCKIHIDDLQGNRLTTAIIYWQLKPWHQVKTAL